MLAESAAKLGPAIKPAKARAHETARPTKDQRTTSFEGTAFPQICLCCGHRPQDPSGRNICGREPSRSGIRRMPWEPFDSRRRDLWGIDGACTASPGGSPFSLMCLDGNDGGMVLSPSCSSLLSG